MHLLTKSKTSLACLIATYLFMIAAISSRAAVLTGDTGSHDPSRMTYCNGNYYVYSTGGGMISSPDRINWTTGTSPFPNGVPTSVKNLIPSNQGIWAPDVLFVNNTYYLYYAVAAADGTKSAIGLLTSPTLDPSVSGYKWTDAGVVISDSDKVDLRTSIDPCPVLDASGNLWLSYGSGYANGATWSDPTIFLVQLNPSTGLQLNPSSPTLYPVADGHIEASYVHYHGGNYFLFWNSGGCCSGTASTYTIHVAESPSITGPYVDKSGTVGASETFLETHGSVHGPGQIGIYTLEGSDSFSYHYYPNSGGAVLGMQTLLWGTDGWPSAGTDLANGTYTFTSQYNSSLVIGISGASNTVGALIDEETYTSNTHQQWNVTLDSDGYYTIASVANGDAIDIYQANPANGTAIDAWTSSGSSNQRWFLEETSDGYYRAISKLSQSGLDAPYGKHTSGTDLDEWGLNGGTNQKWTLANP
jgi:arabinan endo-1,5-alpha-L-arabinosidase